MSPAAGKGDFDRAVPRRAVEVLADLDPRARLPVEDMPFRANAHATVEPVS